MANAIRDENREAVWLGTLYSDGVTLVPIAIDNQDMKVNEVNTISFTPEEIANRDDNRYAVLMAVDSTDDTKLCPVYVDSSGAVLTG